MTSNTNYFLNGVWLNYETGVFKTFFFLLPWTLI